MGFIGRAVAPSPISANDVPDLPASKITSGTFAESFLTNATTDLQPLKSDITALALREATNESSASFNLPNQHIDTFATDTLGTKTNTSVVSGYVASSIDNTPTGTQLYLKSNSASNNSTTISDSSGNNVPVSFEGNAKNIVDGGSNIIGTSAYWIDGGSDRVAVTTSNFSSRGNFGTGAFTLAGYFRFNSVSSERPLITFGGWGGSADYNGWSWFHNASNKLFFYARQGNSTVISVSSDALSLASDTWYHLAVTRDSSSTIKFWKNGVLSGTHTSQSGNIASFDDRNLQLGRNGDDGYTYAGRFDNIIINKGYDLYTSNFTAPTSYYGLQTNTTGTAIQDTNTVGSSKSNVGGTFLYKNNSGTATLGTDLKIYFTCNGGTNWTEASSYNAITPVYSTGISQVRLGKTTCTAGTDVRYKVEWANQSGSKTTQLHGIGINY